MKSWYCSMILLALLSSAGAVAKVGLHPGTITSTAGLIIAQISPTPTYDPLVTPALPENPSEAEVGKFLYYFHCMPCHGDLGQGLTDEFRQVWVEDHQNCWGRGCHGGRPEDEGFPIPTVVPRVISEMDALTHFQSFEALETYLHDTHPPQYPGKLKADEYRELTAYLWESNHKPVRPAATAVLPATAVKTEPAATQTREPILTQSLSHGITDPTQVNPGPMPASTLDPAWMFAGLIVGTLAVFSLTWIIRRRKP